MFDGVVNHFVVELASLHAKQRWNVQQQHRVVMKRKPVNR